MAPVSIVSTSRNNIEYVVAEYVIVNLRGQSVAVRAKRLISIAHPAFREELEYSARRKMLAQIVLK